MTSQDFFNILYFFAASSFLLLLWMGISILLIDFYFRTFHEEYEGITIALVLIILFIASGFYILLFSSYKLYSWIF